MQTKKKKDNINIAFGKIHERRKLITNNNRANTAATTTHVWFTLYESWQICERKVDAFPLLGHACVCMLKHNMREES